MDITSLQSSRVKAANLSLDQLATSTHVPESEKVKEVSRAFEAVLLRQILSESQRPVFQSKYIGNSTADGISRDLVVNQMAEDISKSGSFGLGKSLARELQRQSGAAKHTPPEVPKAGKSHFKIPSHE
jgi:Rod binding domain-containing protein